MQVSKRKTRKQKQKTQRAQLERLYHDPEVRISLVKREIKGHAERKKSEAKEGKESKHTAKIHDDYFNKPAIVKSLLLASLILSLEVVLYFVWR